MQGEPGEHPIPPDDEPDLMVTILQRQMVRLRRFFEWERWLLEPRSFAPPDEHDEEPPHGNA
jgi:hypothetical protein